MNRRTRFLLNRTASWLTDLSEACERASQRLRAKAERKPRPRPLVFPSEFDLMISRMMEASMRSMVDQIAAYLIGGPKPVRITDDIPYVVPGQRGAEPEAHEITPIVGTRYPVYKDGT